MNPTTKIGTPVSRIDGRLKVTGEACYASDVPLANPAYAFLATSVIARGRIGEIGESDGHAVPGAPDVLTKVSLVHADHNTRDLCASRLRCRTCLRSNRQWMSYRSRSTWTRSN